jgi:hypothetical protein
MEEAVGSAMLRVSCSVRRMTTEILEGPYHGDVLVLGRCPTMAAFSAHREGRLERVLEMSARCAPPARSGRRYVIDAMWKEDLPRRARRGGGAGCAEGSAVGSERQRVPTSRGGGIGKERAVSLRFANVARPALPSAHRFRCADPRRAPSRNNPAPGASMDRDMLISSPRWIVAMARAISAR